MKAIVRKEVHLHPNIVKRMEKEAKKLKVSVKYLMESAILDLYGDKPKGAAVPESHH